MHTFLFFLLKPLISPPFFPEALPLDARNLQGTIAVLQLLFCCNLCFSRCALCRSVTDSYDSLNVKYGLNGQVVFARVNVDQLKVSNANLTSIYS